MVHCRMGEEKQTALLLMRKFIAYEFTDTVMTLLCHWFLISTAEFPPLAAGNQIGHRQRRLERRHLYRSFQADSCRPSN